jgi:hypothetical protein
VVGDTTADDGAMVALRAQLRILVPSSVEVLRRGYGAKGTFIDDS